MLSAKNLTALDEAGLGFTVGLRTTKAPTDPPPTSAGTATPSPTGRPSTPFTPKNSRIVENDAAKKAEPVWNPQEHTASWRAVWPTSAKRAARTRHR